jgi:hypothetical protein
MLQWHTAHFNSGIDSFSAARDNELMHVGASYVSAYLNNRSWGSIRLSEVVRLNGYAVAHCVAPDLDDNGKAGIARTMANLVARARMFDLAA